MSNSTFNRILVVHKYKRIDHKYVVLGNATDSTRKRAQCVRCNKISNVKLAEGA